MALRITDSVSKTLGDGSGASPLKVGEEETKKTFREKTREEIAAGIRALLLGRHSGESGRGLEREWARKRGKGGKRWKRGRKQG